MDIILVILLSYISGSIPFGLILTKIFGKIDIRKIGSGNIGVILDTVTFAQTLDNPSSSIGLITEIADLLYTEAIDANRVSYFEAILLDNFSSGYWSQAWSEFTTTGDNSVIKPRLDELVKSMVNAAEFQLM